MHPWDSLFDPIDIH